MPQAGRRGQGVRAVLLLLALWAGPAGAQTLDRGALTETFRADFRDFQANAVGMLPGGRRVWKTTFIFGDRTLPANHEAQWYADPEPAPSPFRVVDGVLRITAAPAPGLPDGLTYRSGLITSQMLFRQQYGYFEMVARMPAEPGFWPAFWLLPVNGTWPPEIDAMEVVTKQPRTLHVNLHSQAGGVKLDRGKVVPTGDLTAGFHRYGVAWRPDVIRWYLDDTEVFSVPTPADMHLPMYLLANLAVGTGKSWPGAPTRPGATAMLEIAGITAWQFRDLLPGRP